MEYEEEKELSYYSFFKTENEEGATNLFFNDHDSYDEFHSNFKLAFNNEELYYNII